MNTVMLTFDPSGTGHGLVSSEERRVEAEGLPCHSIQA